MKTQLPAYLKLPLVCIIFIILQGLNPVICYSQETSTCAEKLKTAQTLFEKGQVDQVSELISGCLRSGLTREESLSAYKLLIQTYLFEDKLDLADSTMLAFLKKNPEYQISATDHSSFVNLFGDFIPKKLLQLSFHVGTNLPFISVIKSNSLSPIKGESGYSAEALNFFGSVETKFKLTGKIELNAEVGYSQLSFHKYEYFMGFALNNYDEFQKRIDATVSATYDFKTFGRFIPYCRLGTGPSFFWSTNSVSFQLQTDENNPYDHSGMDIDRGEARIPFDLIVQAGAGIKYKTREGFIFAELRSNFGTFNQVMPGRQLTGELPWYYYLDDDDFRVNSFNLNFGYTFIFYKPSKRKE